MKRFLLFLFASFFLVPFVSAQTPTPSYDPSEWFMAGANPQRTSWVSTQVPSDEEIAIPGGWQLHPEWYISFEPYIPYGWQMVVVNETIYVSTARGLYAIDVNAGQIFQQVQGTAEEAAQPWIKWVYPTELPLGQSPTVVKNAQGEVMVYVGGFDKKLHAIRDDDVRSADQYNSDHSDYTKLWSFDSGDPNNPEEFPAGFSVNPLVVNNTVYAGNRNGWLYAVDVSNGNLKWKYQTGGSIDYSAAASTDSSTIYFASNDSYAYALNSADGSVRWKSQKLPGGGFLTWWPVVWRDKVIFSGSYNARSNGPGDEGHVNARERNDLFASGPINQPVWPPDHTLLGTLGTVPGDWVAGTTTMDMSKVLDYYAEPDAGESTDGIDRRNHKPWRRNYFVLNASNGQEYTMTYNGKTTYPPIIWTYTHAGNRFPPVIGTDNVAYQYNWYAFSGISRSQLTGWTPGSTVVTTIGGEDAIDEPRALSGGGHLIYTVEKGDSDGHAYNYTIPVGQPNREFRYWNEYDEPLSTLFPHYNQGYITTPADETWNNYQAFGGKNGVYGKHGNQNPLIPYRSDDGTGRLFVQQGNSLLAFSKTSMALELPKAQTVTPVNEPPTITKSQLTVKLELEIQKILDIDNFLQPGFINNGSANLSSSSTFLAMFDYWQYPSDTVSVLIQAYPHVNTSMQDIIVAYLKKWYFSDTAFGDSVNSPLRPWVTNKVPWKDGTKRIAFDYSPEVSAAMSQGTGTNFNDLGLWDFNPMALYSIWQYAQLQHTRGVHVAEGLFNRSVNPVAYQPWMMRSLEYTAGLSGATPDSAFVEYPWALNGYIAGLEGFTKLYDLALSEGMTPIASTVPTRPFMMQQYRDELARLKAYRGASFSPDTAYVPPTRNAVDTGIYSIQEAWSRGENGSRNFIYLVPELAESLKITTIGQIQRTVDMYDNFNAFWMMSNDDSSYGENAVQPLVNTSGLFQARAQILHQSQEDLIKYLDVPGLAVGDMYYIQNLVSLLEAPSTGITVSPTPNGSGSPTPTSPPGDTDGDTDVDIFDYNAVITDFGRTGGQGFSNADFDGDGDVDIFDYNVVISNFGR